MTVSTSHRSLFELLRGSSTSAFSPACSSVTPLLDRTLSSPSSTPRPDGEPTASSPLSASSSAALSCGSDTPPVTSANSPVPDLPASEPEVTDLTTENDRLREEVPRLKDQLMCVLDHTIESDTRLLQHTDQVL
ncbi:hypothetical protein J6590_088305 [Homalodisca vitripennis]|nr:hypothetical protein J6590_088305 [Homalodisca vitripennis]